MIRLLTLALAGAALAFSLAELVTLGATFWPMSLLALILAIVSLLRAMDSGRRQKRRDEEIDREYQARWEAMERGELPP